MLGLSTIAGILTTRVRIATTGQLAAACGVAPATLARRLGAMARTGWVQSGVGSLRCPVMLQPVFAWRPEDPEPSFQRLAWRLDCRWAATEPAAVRLWWATPQAVAEFGGVGGRVRQPLQLEHDCAVSEVFVRRGRDADWRMEDLLTGESYGGKVPDAVIVDPGGADTVIEIGGQYPASRIEAFHQAMRSNDLTYELW